MLVNNCRIYDEDKKARYAHYKSLSEKKGRINIMGNHIELQLTKGNKELQMRKS